MPELDLTGSKSSESKSSESSRKEESGDRSERTVRRHGAEVRERLGAVVDRLAEWREARGDVELADALREDAKTIVGGFESLVRSFAWVRAPLLVALGVVEPLLAFGRILRILGGRLADRRARAREQAEAEAEAAAAETPAPVAGEPRPPWESEL
jgi:hypothetical protein